MPVPNPSKNETESDFISRCMSEIGNEYDQERGVAICYASWDKENMSVEMEEFKTLPEGDCLEKAKSAGYTEQYAKWACTKKEEPNDGQQGGVAMSKEFARTKFEYPPTHKETMPSFMSRCMSDSIVREKKKDRGFRAGWCYSQYQNNYINNIGKKWK